MRVAYGPIARASATKSSLLQSSRGSDRCASERPQPDTFVIDTKPVRKAPDRSFRVRSQSRRAIEQVLRRVVGGISDEGFWVDDEPGLAFRPEDVACVPVGRQHELCQCRAWQLRKEAQTFAD